MSYLLTSIPLTLAFPDNTFIQSQKAPLRNFLIEDAKALCKQPNEVSDWFIDSMAAVNSIGSKDTWKEYADKFLKYCMAKDSSRVKIISMIFDFYKQNSIKQMMQLEKAGEEMGRNVYITNVKQKMPQNADWYSFLQNNRNKTELISALVGYFKSEEIRRKFSYPVIIKEEENTWHLSSIRIQELPRSNHVEADTRIIMEALRKRKNCDCQGY